MSNVCRHFASRISTLAVGCTELSGCSYVEFVPHQDPACDLDDALLYAYASDACPAGCTFVDAAGECAAVGMVQCADVCVPRPTVAQVLVFYWFSTGFHCFSAKNGQI